MVPATNKAKSLSSVNYTRKKIHDHHHHNHQNDVIDFFYFEDILHLFLVLLASTLNKQMLVGTPVHNKLSDL